MILHGQIPATVLSICVPLFAFVRGAAAVPVIAAGEQPGPLPLQTGPPPPPGGPPASYGGGPGRDDGPKHGGPGAPQRPYTPPGKWWNNSHYIQLLGLTADQQKRIDEVFNRNRLVLIDISAALEKEEAILEPLLAADRLDEAKILAQIDRVASARAALEKGNARMLLGFRTVLTQEQWKRLLDTSRPEPPPSRQ